MGFFSSVRAAGNLQQTGFFIEVGVAVSGRAGQRWDKHTGTIRNTDRKRETATHCSSTRLQPLTAQLASPYWRCYTGFTRQCAFLRLPLQINCYRAAPWLLHPVRFIYRVLQKQGWETKAGDTWMIFCGSAAGQYWLQQEQTWRRWSGFRELVIKRLSPMTGDFVSCLKCKINVICKGKGNLMCADLGTDPESSTPAL